MPTEKSIKWSIARFCATIIIAVGLVVWISVRESSVAHKLQEAQVETCETSGNPIRETLSEILEEQIKESHSPFVGKLEEALELSHNEVEEIISAQNKQREKRLKQIKPYDCEQLFEK